MKLLQLALLAVFVLFAALTALQQVQYGMIAGRSESGDPQDDPKAKACRKRSAFCAVAAAVSLAACIAVGAMNR